MADDNSRWLKWTKNGRLATLVWGATFLVWISFKVAKIPLEGLDTVFIIMSGAWVTNLGISTVKPGEQPSGKRADDA
ncbi:hypothetical protein [Mycolicibacterium sp. XJ1819]